MSCDDRRCAACGKSENVKACSRCKEVFFCNVECQKVAWPGHKPFCGKKATSIPSKPWLNRLESERKNLTDAIRNSPSVRMLPGAVICASAARNLCNVGAKGGAEDGRIGSNGAAEAFELLGVAHPSAGPAASSLCRLIQDATGTAVASRLGATDVLNGKEPVALTASVAPDMNHMMRDLHSRGASGGAKPRVGPPNARLQALLSASSSSLPAALEAVLRPAKLAELTGGFAWAFLDVLVYEEVWIPCFSGEPVVTFAGVQLLGRLPASKHTALTKAAQKLSKALALACGGGEGHGSPPPISMDVERLPDPVESINGSPAAPSALRRAMRPTSATCVLCDASLRGRPRFVCLQCPERKAGPLCSGCVESHNDGHTSLRVAVDTAAQPSHDGKQKSTGNGGGSDDDDDDDDDDALVLEANDAGRAEAGGGGGEPIDLGDDEGEDGLVLEANSAFKGGAAAVQPACYDETAEAEALARTLARRLCFGDRNVQPPLAVGCALCRFHPEAECGRCHARGFAGVLWRDAEQIDFTLCGACFDRAPAPDESPDEPPDEAAGEPPAEPSAQSSSPRAGRAWFRLAGFGGGAENIFERPASVMFMVSKNATASLLVTSQVFEFLWGQGATFEKEWARHGLVELAPIPPSFQPRVAPLQRTWEGYMRDYIRLAKKATKARPPVGGAITPLPRGVGPSECPATDLSELCALTPLCTEPLIYMVPHFLTERECDHLAVLGSHRSAPSAGGLIHALGSSEWAPLDAADTLARELEERAGRLVDCAPHADDGGFKLAYTHHEMGKEAGGLRAPEGVHLDTNKRPHRHVTVRIRARRA